MQHKLPWRFTRVEECQLHNTGDLQVSADPEPNRCVRKQLPVAPVEVHPTLLTGPRVPLTLRLA